MNNAASIQFLGTDDLSPRSHELILGAEKLWAFSKGAHYTYFIFKKKKIAFDLGFCPMEAVPCTDIFITHAHEDHSCGIFRHIQFRKLFKLPPATYYFPSELVEPFRAVLTAWNNFNQRGDQGLPCTIGLSPGQKVVLKKGIEISAFETHHRGPTLGFHWTNVNNNPDVPFFSYLGDHTVQSLQENPLLAHSKFLSIEITFLEGSEEKAETYRHMHLNHLVELWNCGYFKNELIILKHLSSRYSTSQVKEILTSKLTGKNRPEIIVI